MKCMAVWEPLHEVFRVQEGACLLFENRVGFKTHAHHYLFIEEAFWLLAKEVLLIEDMELQSLIHTAEHLEDEYRGMLLLTAYAELRGKGFLVRRRPDFIR
jgi:hypothetical protein